MHEIRHLSQSLGEEIEIKGWLVNSRSSGKIVFLQIRDGSGIVQAVASQG